MIKLGNRLSKRIIKAAEIVQLFRRVTMSSSQFNTGRKLIAWLTLFTFIAMPLSLVAQTQIKYHSNRYSPQDDLKVGSQAAQEVEQQMPLLRDETIGSYVERVGRSEERRGGK